MTDHVYCGRHVWINGKPHRVTEVCPRRADFSLVCVVGPLVNPDHDGLWVDLNRDTQGFLSVLDEMALIDA